MARIMRGRKFPATYGLFIGECWDVRRRRPGPRSMTSDSCSIAAPEHCILQHRLFASFADPLLRRAESDGAPVMVVKLGDREAAIPLRSLQREFAIADDSDDGRMLGLIAQSLDFISLLRVGDALPTEVL